MILLNDRGQNALHQQRHIWKDNFTRYHDQEGVHYDQFALSFTLFLEFFTGFGVVYFHYFSQVCGGTGALSTCLVCLMMNPALCNTEKTTGSIYPHAHSQK